MVAGSSLAVLIVVAIVAFSVLRSEEPVHHLELVPPQPAFGLQDRTIDVSGTATPYGPGQLSLRELAEQAGILVGAAVEPDDMAWEAPYNPLVVREFNVVATENVLKLGLIRKTPDRYVFGPADVIVDFAAQNGLEVRGHTLVWHEEVPQWLKVQGPNREELSALLREHIELLVGRYQGRIQHWDVLNEAIEWDGSLRDTMWLRTLGPEFMDEIFHWAHTADPDAKLFYNDFSAEGLGDKSDAVYELVKGMLERGVPIHGVGFQGHFNIEEPPDRDAVAANIERLAALGLEVQFTEVDVRIETPVTDEDLEAQAAVYWSMFSVCVENPACTAFLTWGVTDKHSWIRTHLNGYDAGLLFDDHFDPKPAYWALRDVLERRLGIGSYAD